MSGTVAVDDAFLTTLAKAFAGARGNDRFVKTRPLSALTSAWALARSLSPSSVPPPAVDPSTGMVPWLSWAALLAERELGRGVQPATTPPTSPSQLKLWQREKAAQALAQAPSTSLLDASVQVRRVEAQRALLTMVLDRASAEGLFVRVAVDAWVPAQSDDGVLVDDDKAAASSGLKDVLSLASALPAPALLVRAAALPGVVVERLSRGVVGPCLHKHGPPLIDVDDGDFALVVSSEELALDIAATADNDAFADDDLGALVRALPKPLQAFKAFRDAKAVATTKTAQKLKQKAAQKKTKTVIHELR